ncbi:hypothetical protein GWI33_008784 [Rhynchophorus ferrugineus]|uniref:U1-type domain-containing protein n=1 Tax=Rhynchophorus ferrugineus TaxID=354439 RepID=A0A834MAV3_RHYFE|nr:hypothetical protein GWI33_008784 [Rhynchophorus ferrugineus]
MGDGYYRVSGEVSPNLQPSEIHVNKDFIAREGEWFPSHFGSKLTTMYNNTNQYPPSEYANSYPVYSYGNAYGYSNYGYQDQTNQPGPPGEFSQNNWNQLGHQNYSTVPQPPQEEAKTEAVVQEMQHQKATLTKQREDYVRKAMVLRRELDQLRQQKQDLANNDRSDKELSTVLKKNERLQDEINGKLKAILNVVEMLSSIIRDGKKIGDLEDELDKEEKFSWSSQQPHGTESNRYSPATSNKTDLDSAKEGDKRFSYVYYDTGLHWCRACDEFPETAKEYLQHLHSKDHQEMAKENEVDITPWHKLPLEPIVPSYDDAPKKRVPIKGLQFFISAPSWYCKLCDIWIGDLHCASHHLKSQAHSQNYQNFVEQNPHWETEWLKDREKAMCRNGKNLSSDSDASVKKKKRKHRSSIESLLKEKKKKKRSKKKKKDSSDSSSSSSSSDSSSDEESNDRSKSIRVAMRNMSQVKSIINEDMSKWTVLEKLLEDHRKRDVKTNNTEDELISQWMTVSEPTKEKNILDTLKDRMRVKQEIEKAKFAEIERRRKEKERQEQELQERKQRQIKEEAERLEKEKQRKQQEETQRILDKDRGHVKFRPSREQQHRRKKSGSEDDVDDKRYSKSKETSASPRNHRDYGSSKSRYSSDRDTGKRRSESSSNKKLPFIGRMPLFKKKIEPKMEREAKVIKKEEYEPQRKTRFETGNLAKAFIPRPDVVCFPVLSSIPPITAPPPPPPPPILSGKVHSPKHTKKHSSKSSDILEDEMVPPKAPSISKPDEIVPPPPPIIKQFDNSEENTYTNQEFDHDAMGEYYESFNNMMYQTQQYEYQEEQEQTLPHPPLEPPPLPPDDDLALLGICADDMAAQTF